MADQLIRLFHAAATLKALPRTGWVRAGVPMPESVAAHCFGVALLAFPAARERGLNAERAVMLAMAHEIGEAVIGDLTPADGVSDAAKHALESAAVRRVLDGLPAGPELLELWLDYENRRSPEAELVKQLDKLDMALQADRLRR